MWYGVSSIAARFINYLLTPYLTYAAAIKTADYGNMGLIYSAIPIFNVLFTYGFETAYFRFASIKDDKQSVYSTAAISILASTICFTLILWLCQGVIVSATGLTDVPSLVQLSILIIAFDALNKIPFARLRQQGRPILYAFINVSSIVLNVFLTWFFISYCPKHNEGFISSFYNANTNPIVYVLIANLAQSVFTLLLLSKEFFGIGFKFNKKLWQEMFAYAWPLLIAGFGGVINETMDRLMLNWWVPGSDIFKKEQVGIYNACYKLSILITLFVTAFKLGAEPFFFKQAESVNPQRVYARVMKFFVIAISTMFLVVTLFMPVWKHFIGPKYWEGLSVVPVLLFANMFLGIYYNLSIWYKLSNNTKAGAIITFIGAAITISINFLLIPHFSYMACAWATFCCYGSMMVLSFIWGQKAYPVPYVWKKLVAYMVIVALLFLLHKGILYVYTASWFSLLVGALLLYVFVWFILLVERKEFQKLPVVGKYIK
jgi:O-antigen/teichoic acid export membrane protein